MIVACGTNDGKNFFKGHFGDSDIFLIYRVDSNGFELIDKIKNDSPEEEMHGDPKKAKYIAGLLRSKNVDAVFAYAMGPNIVRIRRIFLPIISRIENIEDALYKLVDKISDIKGNLNKKEKPVVYIE